MSKLVPERSRLPSGSEQPEAGSCSPRSAMSCKRLAERLRWVSAVSAQRSPPGIEPRPDWDRSRRLSWLSPRQRSEKCRLKARTGGQKVTQILRSFIKMSHLLTLAKYRRHCSHTHECQKNNKMAECHQWEGPTEMSCVLVASKVRGGGGPRRAGGTGGRGKRGQERREIKKKK